MVATGDATKRDEFRRVRSALGLTQAQLARRLGVSRRTVVRWEAGESPVGPVYQSILRYLEASLPPGSGAGRGGDSGPP